MRKMPPGTTEDQVNRMLQNLLAERFGLKFHHEAREVAGYELVVGKNGSRKLKPASEPPVGDSKAAPPVTGSTAGKQVLDDDGYPEIPQRRERYHVYF